jgi:hypothetical protein
LGGELNSPRHIDNRCRNNFEFRFNYAHAGLKMAYYRPVPHYLLKMKSENSLF